MAHIFPTGMGYFKVYQMQIVRLRNDDKFILEYFDRRFIIQGTSLDSAILDCKWQRDLDSPTRLTTAQAIVKTKAHLENEMSHQSRLSISRETVSQLFPSQENRFTLVLHFCSRWALHWNMAFITTVTRHNKTYTSHSYTSNKSPWII
jgi:hypothetical protein